MRSGSPKVAARDHPADPLISPCSTACACCTSRAAVPSSVPAGSRCRQRYRPQRSRVTTGRGAGDVQREIAHLPGYTPPAGTPISPPAPVIPQTALQSVDSPQSILQAVRDNVQLAGGREAPVRDSAWATRATTSGGTVTVTLRATGPGTAHVHLYREGAGVLGARTVTVTGAGTVQVRVPVSTTSSATPDVVLIGFVADSGGTLASGTAIS